MRGLKANAPVQQSPYPPCPYGLRRLVLGPLGPVKTDGAGHSRSGCGPKRRKVDLSETLDQLFATVVQRLADGAQAEPGSLSNSRHRSGNLPWLIEDVPDGEHEGNKRARRTMNDTGTDQNGNRDGGEGALVDDSRREVAHTALAALTEMARTMDDLKSRIDPAIAEIRHGLITNDPEVEIGKLFVHVQEFIDQAVTEAQQNAAQLLVEARREAERIVAEGHNRSRNTTEQAALIAPAPAMTAPAPAPVFVDVAQQLRQSMEAFTRRNSELTDALAPTRQ